MSTSCSSTVRLCLCGRLNRGPVSLLRRAQRSYSSSNTPFSFSTLFRPKSLFSSSSKYSREQQLQQNNAPSALSPDPLRPQIDVKKYTEILEKEGFSKAQAESLVNLVAEAIDEGLVLVTREAITKAEQQRIIEGYQEEFTELRKDISVLGKKDFAHLKSELERIIADTRKIKESMRGEIQRVHAGVKLDVNLEKGRVKEETAYLDQKLADANKKVVREIEGLKQRMAGIEHEMTTTIGGVMVLLFGVFVGTSFGGVISLWWSIWYFGTF